MSREKKYVIVSIHLIIQERSSYRKCDTLVQRLQQCKSMYIITNKKDIVSGFKGIMELNILYIAIC